MRTEVDGVLVAAHELKAPLAVLRQLALSLEGLDVAAEQIREEMVAVSEQAIRQVNDLAKIRNLEAGLFEMEPVAVRAVCDDVGQEIARLYGAEGLKISSCYQNRARLAYANYELLFSVIYNFATNALHFGRYGPATILRVSEAKGKMRILVRDFGPALPTGMWRRLKSGEIDQPTATAMRPGSSGLGLYIASKFSRYMHAEVGAVRHHDGTSFFVELPISKQASLFV